MRFIGIVAGVLMLSGVAFAGEDYNDFFTMEAWETSPSSCCDVKQSQPTSCNWNYESNSDAFEVYESSWTWMFE